MRRAPLLVLAMLLLAGCSAPPDAPTNTTATAPTVTTSTPAEHRSANATLVELDGRWSFDETAARAVVAAAGASRMGAAWLGEARLAAKGSSVAGDIAAFDDEARAALGGAPEPARGEAYISATVASALGVAVGDEIAFTSYAWPDSSVTAAFEMERVRACDLQVPAALCSNPTSAAGEAILTLRVPPHSRDLRFHADVVELRPQDYPAEWDGEFRSPSGIVTPFETGARDRADVSPPGYIGGALEPGDWTIRFILTANGSQARGAIAGFITYSTLGFSPFNIDLLRDANGERQTRSLLANGTRHDLTLRVAGEYSPGAGAAALTRAIALLAPEDARALLDIRDENATALVLADAPPGFAKALSDATRDAQDAAARVLRARPAAPRPVAQEADTILWAPPDLDVSMLSDSSYARAVLTVQGGLPVGGELRVGGALVKDDARVLALPADSTRAPWTIIQRALWNGTPAAYVGMAGGPHLVMMSVDLARGMGLNETNLTYTKIELDSAIGPRTIFGMGAVAGGPPHTVWTSAALLAAGGRPVGARLLVANDAPLDALVAAWASAGVARLLDG